MPNLEEMFGEFELDSESILSPSSFEREASKPQDDFLTKPIIDYAKSILGETPVDVFTAGARGAWGALQDTYGFVDWATGGVLIDWNSNPLGESTTQGGKIVEAISNFAAGFVPVAGTLGKLGQSGKAFKYLKNRYVRDFTAGAITDFLVWDGHEERFSNLIQSVPALENPITEFLASDDEDNEAVGRIKNVLEGAALGFMADGVLAGLFGFKAGSKALAEGASKEEASRAAVEAAQARGVDDVFTPKVGDEVAPTPAPDLTPDQRLEIQEDLFEVEASARTGSQAEAGNLNPRKLKKSERFLEGLRSGEINTAHYDGDSSSLIRHAQRELELEDVVPDEITIQETVDELATITASSNVDLFRKQIRKRAEALSGDGRDFFRTLRVMRVVLDETADGIAQRYFGRISQLSDTDLATAVSEIEMLSELASYVKGASAEAGRGFRSLGIPHRRFRSDRVIQKRPNALEETVRAIKESNGGSDKIKEKLKQLKALYDANGAGAVIKGAALTRGDILKKFLGTTWMSGLISHPKTLTLGLFGPLNAAVIRPIEMLTGGALDFLRSGDSKSIKAALAHVGSFFNIDNHKAAFKYFGAAFKSGRVLIDNLGTVDYKTGFGRAMDADKAAVLFGNENPSEMFKWFANAVGAVVEYPFSTMSAIDQYVKTLDYRANLSSSLTARFLDDAAAGKMDIRAVRGEVVKKVEELASKAQYYSEATIFDDLLAKHKQSGVDPLTARQNAEAELETLLENPELIRDLDISEQAIGYTRENTGTLPLEGRDSFAIVGRGLQSLANQIPIIRAFAPFIRTPTNILRFVYERSVDPIVGGFLGMAYKKFGKNVQASRSRFIREIHDPDPFVRAQAKGRLGFAVSSFMMVANLYENDRITGRGPKDPALRKIWQETGRQPYSIRIGDEWVSYQRLDPMASMVGIVSDIMEYSRWSDEDGDTNIADFGYAIAIALAENFTNKSYLTGIENLMDFGSDPATYASKIAKTLASSLVPNVFRVGTDYGEEHFKEVRGPLDAVMAKLPYFNDELPPARNILGEKVERIRSALAEETLGATDVFLPVFAQSVSDDVVFNELVKIQAGFKNPSDIQANIDLRKFKSDTGQDAYDRWMELVGEAKIGGLTLRERLRATIESPSYQRLPDTSTPFFDTPRKNRLRAVINRYRDHAKRLMRREYPELDDALKTVERGKRVAALGGAFDGTALEDFAPEFF